MRKHPGSTKRKLEEAEFFLGQLAPNYLKERKFDFFLSAFVSSARAIPWVMKSEYGKVAGWKAWYGSRKPTLDEENLLKGTNALRTRLTKQEALRTTARIQLGGVKLSKAEYARVRALLQSAPKGGVPIQLGGNRGKYHLQMEVEGEKLVLPATEVYFDRRLPEFPDVNILDLCQRYYESLAKLVRECEERFDA
jgi:hypothetical protein